MQTFSHYQTPGLFEPPILSRLYMLYVPDFLAPVGLLQYILFSFLGLHFCVGKWIRQILALVRFYHSWPPLLNNPLLHRLGMGSAITLACAISSKQRCLDEGGTERWTGK